MKHQPTHIQVPKTTPLNGACQGRGHTSTFWTVIRSELLKLFEKSQYCMITTPITKESSTSNAAAFVDDQNTSINDNTNNLVSLIHKVKTVAQT